jgi:hypothetical protein
MNDLFCFWTGFTGYTGYFFALRACPVEGGDERQKNVIPLRGRELREGRNTTKIHVIM